MLISLYGLVFNPDTVQPQLHYLEQFMPPAAFSLISDRVQSLAVSTGKGLGLGCVISLSSPYGLLHRHQIGSERFDHRLPPTRHRGLIEFQLLALGMTLSPFSAPASPSRYWF